MRLCQKCGAVPRIEHNRIIVPGESSWAIWCQNGYCNNDTHWQKSFTMAAEMWDSNPCENEFGGQGDPDDDSTFVVH